MTNWGKFEKMHKMQPMDAKPMECVVCEGMCPDAVDGTLTEPERRVFEEHIAQCASCARELEEAQRGAAWLGMLKGHTPEPPAALLAKILAETTGIETAAARQTAARETAASPVSAIPVSAIPVAAIAPPVGLPVREPAPAWALSSALNSALNSLRGKLTDVFRIEQARATFQPRLAMTAAMAFVSIALTLNMTGVRLKNLRASDFTPSGLRRNVAEASATAARNFQNMRVVYQVESRVSELRGEGPLAQHEYTDYTVQPSGTTQQPEQQAAPAPKRKGL